MTYETRFSVAEPVNVTYLTLVSGFSNITSGNVELNGDDDEQVLNIFLTARQFDVISGTNVKDVGINVRLRFCHPMSNRSEVFD